MSRWIAGLFGFLLLFGLTGCSGDARIVNTFEQTPEEQIEEAGEVVVQTHHEMSDGTWMTDGRTYQYKLVLTGRLHNAVKDTTYTILSNLEEITFEQAWKASGLSSSSDDYFAVEDAVFVAIE